MRIEVRRFCEGDIDTVCKIQWAAFKPLYEKYGDDGTNPFTESKETILSKYTRQGTKGYLFTADGVPVGAVRIKLNGQSGRVSALCVLPEHQNSGIAQSALLKIEELHPEIIIWNLDTILQEAGNCHLYEKLGYKKTGLTREATENMTLVEYKKDKSAAQDELRIYIPRPEDGWFYVKMMSDPATMAYNAPWFPPYGCIPDAENEWLRLQAEWIGKGPKRFYAFLQRVSDGAFVGDINYHYVPDSDWWDMGIVIYAPERGRGYGRQGLGLLVRHAFEADGISRLHNEFEPTRGAAYRIHKEAGFRETGVKDGIIQLELTREEYLAGKPLFFKSDELQSRIDAVAREAALRTGGAARFEECIALPCFGTAILRFELDREELTLDELDAYERTLYDIAGDDFLTDFMGSVYKRAGVDYADIEVKFAAFAERFVDEPPFISSFAGRLRADAERLLKLAGLDPRLRAWEIQAEEDELLLLVMGEGSGVIARTESPYMMTVAEVEETPCTGLYRAACHARRTGVSLGRLLAE